MIEEKNGDTQTPREYRAMAFCSVDSYLKTVGFAQKYAGENGRIATLPDIIDARLRTDIESAAWNQYMTTHSVEYFGYTKRGTPVIIVAHGIGPLSNPETIDQAYNSSLKPKRNGRTESEARIDKSQFLDLEAGKYGEVSIVDFNSYRKLYEYPFLEVLTSWKAFEDPLVKARLGSRFEEYLLRHHKETDNWADKENLARAKGKVEHFGVKVTKRTGTDRYKIIQMSDASYLYREPNPPMAHLLTIGGLSYLNGDSLYTDVHCHGEGNGVRIVGIKDQDPIDDICGSVLVDSEEIAWHLPHFIMDNPNQNIILPSMLKIRNFASLIFTERQNPDSGTGTGEIEFPVSNFEQLGEEQKFVTEIKGYHMFFRYNIDEIIAIAPQGSNSYMFTGEMKIEGDYHTVPVQFFRVDIDTAKYVPPFNELNNDFDTLVWVNLHQR